MGEPIHSATTASRSALRAIREISANTAKVATNARTVIQWLSSAPHENSDNSAPTTDTASNRGATPITVAHMNARKLTPNDAISKLVAANGMIGDNRSKEISHIVCQKLRPTKAR